jgi:hypothetical protein
MPDASAFDGIFIPIAPPPSEGSGAEHERTENMNNDDSTLRALIRLLPPAQALTEQLEKSIHLEIYAGTGDLAIQSLKGIQSSVAQLTSDPYVAALAPVIPEGAGDKEKVSLALLAAGQLAAYLEGQTGLTGGGGKRGGGIHVQTAPQVSITNVEGVPNIGEIMEKALGAKGEPKGEGSKG